MQQELPPFARISTSAPAHLFIWGGGVGGDRWGGRGYSARVTSGPDGFVGAVGWEEIEAQARIGSREAPAPLAVGGGAGQGKGGRRQRGPQKSGGRMDEERRGLKSRRRGRLKVTPLAPVCPPTGITI